MANTAFLGIRRPNVGDPYDKGATGFDPATHVDVLDEIDLATAFAVDWSSLLARSRELLDASADNPPPFAPFARYGPAVITAANKLSSLIGANSGYPPTTATPTYVVSDGSKVFSGHSDGTMYATNDWATWNDISPGTTSRIDAMIYLYSTETGWANNTLIASAGTTIYLSTNDGGAWSQITGASSSIKQFVFFGGRFYGPGATGEIYHFGEGETTVTTVNVANFSAWALVIDSLRNLLVAVGQETTGNTPAVAISSDGTNWTVVTYPTSVSAPSGATHYQPAILGGVLFAKTFNTSFGFDMGDVAIDLHRLATSSELVAYDLAGSDFYFGPPKFARNQGIWDANQRLVRMDNKVFYETALPISGAKLAWS